MVCPANYHLFTDPNLLTSACYYVSPSATSVTWNDARAACMADGGDLAVIRSPEENNFVLSEFTVTSLPFPHFAVLAEMEPPPYITDPFVRGVPWIGVSCSGPTGCGGGLAWIMANYMYVDGTPVSFLIMTNTITNALASLFPVVYRTFPRTTGCCSHQLRFSKFRYIYSSYSLF